MPASSIAVVQDVAVQQGRWATGDLNGLEKLMERSQGSRARPAQTASPPLPLPAQLLPRVPRSRSQLENHDVVEGAANDAFQLGGNCIISSTSSATTGVIMLRLRVSSEKRLLSFSSSAKPPSAEPRQLKKECKTQRDEEVTERMTACMLLACEKERSWPDLNVCGWI